MAGPRGGHSHAVVSVRRVGVRGRDHLLRWRGSGHPRGRDAMQLRSYRDRLLGRSCPRRDQVGLRRCVPPMKRAAIIGAAESDLGVTGLPSLALQAQAITRALDDAGLGLRDIDGLATTGLGRFATTHVAEYFGLDLAWADSTAVGGLAFELYVARAAQALASGQCQTVVISYASNQRSARSRELSGVLLDDTPEAQFQDPYGPLSPVSYYAMAAQRYMYETGAGREQLAEVAVAAREWALLNPKAYRFGAGPLTVDDVLEARPVSSPLGTLDCCLVTDGGGAIVMTTLDRARDL